METWILTDIIWHTSVNCMKSRDNRSYICQPLPHIHSTLIYWQIANIINLFTAIRKLSKLFTVLGKMPHMRIIRTGRTVHVASATYTWLWHQQMWPRTCIMSLVWASGVPSKFWKLKCSISSWHCSSSSDPKVPLRGANDAALSIKARLLPVLTFCSET